MATLTENLNYLQPTSFKLVIDRENYPNLEFFAQSVAHPGMNLAPSEIPFRKVRNIPFAGSALDFGDFTANIILDEDMKAYEEMYNWIIRITDNPLKGALDRTATDVPSSSDITLSILSSHNNQVKQLRYLEATPVALGDIAFESTSGGTEFLTFPVTFRFSHFELV